MFATVLANWDFWKEHPRQWKNGEYCNSDKFCNELPNRQCMSATVATSDEKNTSARETQSQKSRQGGIVTVKQYRTIGSVLDYKRQLHIQYTGQKHSLFGYALNTNKAGNYVKAMRHAR